MGRVYTVVFAPTTVATSSGDVDLFEISPADDKPVRIVGLELAVTSELGDAAEEVLDLRIIRGHSTGGSGGSAPTPQPVDPHDAAAGFAAEVLNTTVASAGTGVTLQCFGMNVRLQPEKWWPPGCQHEASQAQGTIVVRLATAVTDDVTMSGTLWVEEA